MEGASGRALNVPAEAIDHAAQKAFDSISNIASEEGVDMNELVSKLNERIQLEMNRSVEPQRKKQKQGVPGAAPLVEQSTTSLQETVWGVFLLNGGLKYLLNDILFPSFALVDKNCRQKAMQELAIRCKDVHPSLFAAITATADTDDEAPSLSYGQWKRFELDERASRGMDKCDAWPKLLSDMEKDIDVLLEVRRGGTLVCHGMTPLDLNMDFGCVFKVPHWGFDAPLPGRDVVLSEEVIHKTFCEALYGAHSSHLVQTMPPLHVHVVLRRRSTGKMVTIISQDNPNEIIDEFSFKVDYGQAHGPLFKLNGSFYASLELELFYPSNSGDDLTGDLLSFSTRDSSETDTRSQPNCAKVRFDFALCNDPGGSACRDITLAALQHWFQE